MKADLHVHTTISDGSLSYIEVLIEAKKQELTHIGITNHDTVKGLRESIEVGEEIGITVIPGIEISAYDQASNRKVHLLGYDFDLEAPHIQALCTPLLQDRHNNTLWQIHRLKALGYKISEQAILNKAVDGGICYKQHIMQHLIEQGYTNAIYSSLYKQLFKGEGVCNRDIQYINVFDALGAIKADGGYAVLAHPGQLNSYHLIPELVGKGLDGIELNHKDHTAKDYEIILDYAKKYNLTLTGGSDFHGAYGQGRDQIGSILAPDVFEGFNK